MTFSTFVSAALVFATLASVGSCINPTFPYGSKKVRGVNLGGWLVVEPWITPSLFDHTGNDKIVDEWTFCLMQDRSVAQAALQAHWDSWITETDLRDIAAAGLNHVRLPVGHWAWDVSAGEPYIQGQLPYVRKAVSWARKYGLKVIIDLHGAAGSQNAFDNSGVRSDAPLWHTDPWNIQRTNAVMKQIVAEFGPQVDVVSMIQPLNEPASFKDISMLPVVQQYYRDSYGNVRYPPNSAPSNTVLFIHDAFQNFSTGQWMNFMPSPQYAGVALDTHIYQVFSDEENARSGDEHVVSACKNGPDLAEFTANQLWTIVGEWAPAMTDCARYLNGRGVGARYDGTYPSSTAVGSCKGQSGDGSAFTKSHKRFLRKMWEAQVTAFEEGAGWLMWTWKTEEAADWSYQAGLVGGWIPRNPDDRIYPNICAH